MRREGQSGQAIVLGAVAMIALLTMSGLVLMGGSAYWERRHLQEVADSAALAAANKMNASCATLTSQPVSAADAIITSQVGAGSGLTYSSASCATSYVGTNSYSDRLLGAVVTSTITYPYGGSDLKVEVRLSAAMPLELPALLGASSSTITARAVAKFNAASLPGSFAVYSAQGIGCNGSSGASIQIQGSVYSGGAISSGCSIYAHSIKAGSTYTDYGDVLVYPAGQTWVQGGATCSAGTVTGNAICADGLEVSGGLAGTVSCAPAAPSWAGISDYLDSGQGSGYVNPNPCPAPPVVPAPNLLGFVPPEPNLDINAQKTISPSSPQPCPAGRPQNSSGLGSPDYATSQPVYVQGRSFTLTAPLTVATTSSLAVSAIPDPLSKITGGSAPSPTDVLQLTLQSGLSTQSGITLNQSASAGDVILKVNGFTPNFAYPAGTTVTPTYALWVGRVAAGSLSVPAPTGPDGSGLYHFHPGCYGWLDLSRLHAAYTPPGGSSPIPGAVLDPGFFYFNGASQAGWADAQGITRSDPYTGGAGGLCLGSAAKLFGTGVTTEFVNGTSFSTADCGSLPSSAVSAPGFGTASQMFSAPGASTPWCPYVAPTPGDPSPRQAGCQGLLVWSPPYQYQPPAPGVALCQNQGTFYVKGTTSQDYLSGTIYWAGQPQQSSYAPCTAPPTSSSAMNNPGCQYTANSTSQIVGQLICYAINVQGGTGAAALGITMAAANNNTAPAEAGLIE